MSVKRLAQLLMAVDDVDRILILPHNDPDPDAMAGAVALSYLLSQTRGIEGRIAYRGIIGRAENRALMRYLNYPFQRLKETDPAPGEVVALVDTQPGTGNNPWSPQIEVALVIDHHPWQTATATARFSDVRSDLGAVSTILLGYLQAAKVELSSTLATALFYGIKTDTRGLSRRVNRADAEAYFYLQPRIDVSALATIETAQVPVAYFKSFADTLESTRLYGNVAIADMGQMDYPDLTAEMADLLLRLDQVDWVICMGIYNNTLMLAVRTPSEQGGAGTLAQAVVGQDGTAGGHGVMAGGQVPLRGRNPQQVAEGLRQQVLQYLTLGSQIVGQPLV